MAINGLHHAAISTPDIDRLMKWYNNNFGFEEVSRSEWPSGSDQIDDVVGLKNSSAGGFSLQRCLKLVPVMVKTC